MDIKKQKKLLVWVVVILVILNLGAISLFVIQTYSKPVKDTEEYTSRKINRPFRPDGPGRMFTDRVSFNDAQREKLRESFVGHRQAMQIYKDSIRLLRSQLMQELASEDPDSKKLDEISAGIGQYYSRLNKETSRHFMEMKSIADPQQLEELNEFFLDIAKRKHPGPGDGFRHRHRRGRR